MGSFQTVVLEKTLESPSDCKRIQPVYPKGNQSWIFIGRTDVEAETPILQPPDAKNWLIRKDPDAGKDWRQEEKETTEDETVGSHHWLDGCEFEHGLGVANRQGSLVCCSPWGHKELDTTRWLNWTEDNILWKVSTRDLPKGILNRNVVQLLSHVWLFAIPWTAACQASLSFTVPGVCSNSCPLSWWCHPTNRNVRKLFRF